MLKSKDRKIIAYLRKNAKVKLTKVANELKIPTSTVYEKVNNSQGLIQKFTCLVDFKKLGYLARIIFVLKVWKEDKEKLREFLMHSKNVNTLSKINNGNDFLVEAVFEDMREAENFKEQMNKSYKIEDSYEFYILYDLKKESFLELAEQVQQE
ncbi:Lrp/AsnC family transcriptional regulator [Candidatus Woesearchaeota archaeon]|nr:Lrp/AsnC family transcriptional regulator [Candidatus Woesearchaeota archaeon]